MSRGTRFYQGGQDFVKGGWPPPLNEAMPPLPKKLILNTYSAWPHVRNFVTRPRHPAENLLVFHQVGKLVITALSPTLTSILPILTHTHTQTSPYTHRDNSSSLQFGLLVELEGKLLLPVHFMHNLEATNRLSLKEKQHVENDGQDNLHSCAHVVYLKQHIYDAVCGVH